MKCTAKLNNGKPCKRDACLDGLCTIHYKRKHKLFKNTHIVYKNTSSIPISIPNFKKL